MLFRSGELVLSVPASRLGDKYSHGHWPRLTNPIAHTRFSEFTDADGKQVLLVDEVQSDWGQDISKHGVKTDATKGATEAFHKYADALGQRFLDWWVAEYFKRPAKEQVYGTNPKDIAERAEAMYNMETNSRMAKALGEGDVYDALVDAMHKESMSIESGPFVRDTKAWTALVVKRILRYAADNGINRIAFIDGQTAFERFPEDEEGGSTEKGMKTYYDQILPSVVKDVLRKLGADSKSTVSSIETEAKPGYSVYIRNQLVAGPFDSEADAWNEGAELVASGQVEESDDEIGRAHV